MYVFVCCLHCLSVKLQIIISSFPSTPVYCLQSIIIRKPTAVSFLSFVKLSLGTAEFLRTLCKVLNHYSVN